MKTLLAAIALCAVSATTAAAQSVHVLTASTLSPLSRGAEQDMPGFNHELVTMAAERAGLDIKVEYLPWNRAQKMVEEGRDYITFFTRNAAREERFDWIAPAITVSRAFASLDAPVNSMEAAADRGTISAAIVYYRQLDELGWTNIEEADIASSLRKLNAGRVDTVYSIAQRLAFEWRELGFDPSALIIGESVQNSHIWMAASPNYPDEIAEKLRRAMAEMKSDGSYDALYARYFGDMPILPGPAIPTEPEPRG